MRNGKYIILRDKQSLTSLGDVFSPQSNIRMKTGAVNLPEPKIEFETLKKRDILELQKDPEVVSIAPAMPIHLITPISSNSVQIMTEKDATWGVKVTGASTSSYTGEGATVAVLDTGIDASHEAFAGIQLIQKDFTGEGNGDEIGHGTHCAGTIFGRDTSDRRFGIAQGVDRALIGKVLGKKGGSSDQICKAILWAAEENANVISMSLGLDFPGWVKLLIENNYPADLATSMALEDYRTNIRLFDDLIAMVQTRNQMFAKGTVIVAAAGNESKRDIQSDYEISVAPPAVAKDIISVGAFQTDGAPHDALDIAYFSNTGVNISAPGVDVYSAKAGGGYTYMSGTSMATPHVAGIAALWAEKLLKERGSINTLELTSKLIASAQMNRLKSGIDLMDIGAGLVQAPI